MVAAISSNVISQSIDGVLPKVEALKLSRSEGIGDFVRAVRGGVCVL
jgi:hypothetical protein